MLAKRWFILVVLCCVYFKCCERVGLRLLILKCTGHFFIQKYWVGNAKQSDPKINMYKSALVLIAS